MVVATLVLMSVVLVVLAGEAVRGQCRRMLSARPATSAAPVSDAVARSVGSEVAF